MFGGRKYFNLSMSEPPANTFLYSSSTAVKGRAQGTPLPYAASQLLCNYTLRWPCKLNYNTLMTYNQQAAEDEAFQTVRQVVAASVLLYLCTFSCSREGKEKMEQRLICILT